MYIIGASDLYYWSKTHYNGGPFGSFFGQIVHHYSVFLIIVAIFGAPIIVYFWSQKTVIFVKYCSKYQWKTPSNFIENKADSIRVKKKLGPRCSHFRLFIKKWKTGYESRVILIFFVILPKVVITGVWFSNFGHIGKFLVKSKILGYLRVGV